jgi:hypothetical protein
VGDYRPKAVVTLSLNLWSIATGYRMGLLELKEKVEILNPANRNTNNSVFFF